MCHKTTNLQVAVNNCKIYPQYVVQTHTGPVLTASVSLSPYVPYLLDLMACILVSSISSESHNHSAPSSMGFLVLWEEESDEDLRLDSPSPCIMCDCESLYWLPSATDGRHSDDNWTRHQSVSIADFNSIVCSWDSFPPVELYSLSVRVFASSCRILFCHVWLLSHRGLFFSEGRRKVSRWGMG